MQDAQDFRQAVCESAKSDRIVKFITGDKFTESIQRLLDNGEVYGAHFEKSGALVMVDRDGAKHYNTLADGSNARPVTTIRWAVVNPMTGSERDTVWKSRRGAQDAIEELCLSSAWVAMTEKQWAKYKAMCQKPGLTEREQRTLVSNIVGYDY